MSYDIYTGLLKAFRLCDEVKEDVHFSYDNNHPNFKELKNKYPIEDIAGKGDDFTKSKNLLYWVSSHMYHKGDYSGSIGCNSLDLLNYSYDKGNSCGINCVGLATILTECLLAIGLKARKVFIMPCSPYDGDNHVVTQVYIKDLNKWVMLDPTLNAYFINEHGVCLSLLELRGHLADQKAVFFNKEAKYNDEAWIEQSVLENIEYFAKNLFCFHTSEISTFDNVLESRFITLCPQGYNPKQIRLSNIEYRIKKYGDNPHMQKWMEGAKQEEYCYCSSSDFEEVPNYAV